jgi:hypothetical protein
MTAMNLVFDFLGNRKPSKPKAYVFQFISYLYRYVQDFYIGQSRMTAMDLVFGCFRNSKRDKPKERQLNSSASLLLY